MRVLRESLRKRYWAQWGRAGQVASELGQRQPLLLQDQRPAAAGRSSREHDGKFTRLELFLMLRFPLLQKRLIREEIR